MRCRMENELCEPLNRVRRGTREGCCEVALEACVERE